MHKTIVTKQTSHDLRISKINFLVIIYKIKSPTNWIPIMTSPYFPFSMQCLKVSSISLFSLKTILFALVCFVVLCFI
jgi:hypothetical protein